MPPHCLRGWSSSRIATTQTTAAARLWRVLAVLFFLGCVGRRSNDVHAFSISPPSSARSASSTPFSSSSLDRKGSRLVSGTASSPSSSALPKYRFTPGGEVIRRQQQQGACHAVARTSPGVSPLRAAPGDDGFGPGGEEGNAGSEFREGGVGGDGGEAEGEEPGLAMPDIVNPFKLAFEAGQNLRSTLATTLEQITGTASPVSPSSTVVIR